jgi:ribosomal protein S18 acetylase RimI-like enzyme
MQASDLSRVKEIDRAAFSAEEQYGDAVYDEMLQSACSIVIEALDGVVAGYVFAGTEREDSNGSAFGYVRSIAVHPDFRRKGYARALLEAVVQGGDGDIDLFVDEENSPAIELYQRLGFKFAERSAIAPYRRRMVLERK